ncbi:head-tail connector protein [Zobellella sp. DQSA1]|uniref:head-tail connector protein n=1 Tax=Zobellella sp. DQSA1 TaxID=3342386 RepID=UPI0035C2231C
MIAIEVIRAQCKVDDDITSDDAYLQLLLRAAVRHLEVRIQKTLVPLAGWDLEVEDAELNQPLTDDLQLALLFLIGHWYGNREAVVVGEAANSVPLTFDALIQSYLPTVIG